jgi:hypothetical protein
MARRASQPLGQARPPRGLRPGRPRWRYRRPGPRDGTSRGPGRTTVDRIEDQGQRPSTTGQASGFGAGALPTPAPPKV